MTNTQKPKPRYRVIVVPSWRMMYRMIGSTYWEFIRPNHMFTTRLFTHNVITNEKETILITKLKD